MFYTIGNLTSKIYSAGGYLTKGFYNSGGYIDCGWILATSDWDDSGKWCDKAVWID